MACDLCGKVGVPLASLLSIYKTEQVRDICDDCDRVVTKHLRKVQDMTGQIQRDVMRRFITNRKLIITQGAPDASP